MSNIILARDKYYFNNKLNSSVIDFQIKMDNDEMLKGDNYYYAINDESSSSSSFERTLKVKINVCYENQENEIYQAKYNEEKGLYEVIFENDMSVLILKNADVYSGQYEKINEDMYKHKSKEYYIYKKISTSSSSSSQNPTNNYKWYINNGGSSPDVFVSLSEYDNSIIPPFKFKGNEDSNMITPIVLWKNEVESETFSKQMIVKIVADNEDNSSSSSSGSEQIIYEAFTTEVNFDLVDTLHDIDEENAGINDEFVFKEQALVFNKKKNVYYNISVSQSNNDTSSSSGVESNSTSLIRIVKSSNSLSQDEISGFKINNLSIDKNHLYKNYILQIDKKNDTQYDYKLYEASKTGIKNLTFSYLKSLGVVEESSSFQRDELRFDKFNDTDYEIKYNEEKKYWEIIYLAWKDFDNIINNDSSSSSSEYEQEGSSSSSSIEEEYSSSSSAKEQYNITKDNINYITLKNTPLTFFNVGNNRRNLNE